MGNRSSQPKESLPPPVEPFTGTAAELPVATGMLDAELLASLQELPLFSAPEEELVGLGFEKHVDHPNLPGHVYYEGYFHALAATGGDTQAIHPRRGMEGPKPAAPPLMRAFLEAVRRANADALAAMICGDDDGSELFRELHRDGRLLADLAVQVHWGDEVDAAHVGWHSDAANSAIHLALSIRGDRVLHIRTFEDKTQEAHHAQQEGSAYLSAPVFFPHGVEYPERTFENRIIAVQCRTLLTMKQYEAVGFAMSFYTKLQHRILHTLANTDLVVPTVADVQKVLAELK